MKTYRHIPTGKFAVYHAEDAVYALSDGSTIPYNIIELGTDWQEVCPNCKRPLKKGEDIHFKGDCECANVYADILTLHSKASPDSYWTRYNNNSLVWNKAKRVSPLLLEDLLNNPHIYISSIRRLSDGTIFKIGDKVEHTNNVTVKVSTIVGFHLMSNGMWVTTKDYDVPISYIKGLVREPAFKSTDGVDIYEGDNHWFCDASYELFKGDWNSVYHKEYLKILKVFSTAIAANEYRIYNSKVLSIQDILDGTNVDKKALLILKKLVESKIK